MILQHDAASNRGVTPDKSLLLSLTPHHLSQPPPHRPPHPPPRNYCSPRTPARSLDTVAEAGCPSRYTAPCADPCCLSHVWLQVASRSLVLLLVFSQHDLSSPAALSLASSSVTLCADTRNRNSLPNAASYIPTSAVLPHILHPGQSRAPGDCRRIWQVVRWCGLTGLVKSEPLPGVT
jgi:hypothetical protein